MDTWVASISWLLYIMLLWTLGCMYLFELVFLFSSDIYPEVEMLDCMVALFLVFWGTSIPFSTVGAPIYIPTTMHNGSLFSTSSSKLVIHRLLDDGHSDSRVVISLWFGFAFLWRLAMLNIFQISNCIKKNKIPKNTFNQGGNRPILWKL